MTSDERIKIAERMRGPFDVCECVGHTYINGTIFGMQVCARDELALRNGMRYLADLIDPTCHIITTDRAIFGCDRCHTVMLGMRAKPNFCPNCGARLVDE